MSLPLEHLSASSISLFQRCPRQFQERYIRGERSPSSSSLVIGSAVHLGLSRVLRGGDLGTPFEDARDEHLANSGEIIWKDKEAAAKKWTEKMLFEYWEKVGKYLDVKETEKEILLDIPGIDIPLLGYVDITTNRGIIDVKTTGYFSRKPELNPEWKLQMNIYQMEDPRDGEFHILTRSSTNPVVVPVSNTDPLYVNCPTLSSTLSFVGSIAKVMEYYYEEWGDEHDWPGNLVHPWSAKYCMVKNCCQRN
jgi:hypothetical protein